MPPVDKILVLGDTVGYGPDPNAVIDRLRSVRAKAVLGNHDQAILDPSVLDWFNPQAAAAARWTQTVLTPGSRRYLASLPKYGRIGRHRFVHGSPRKPYIWEYILDCLERRYRRREGVSDEDIDEVKKLLKTMPQSLDL